MSRSQSWPPISSAGRVHTVPSRRQSQIRVCGCSRRCHHETVSAKTHCCGHRRTLGLSSPPAVWGGGGRASCQFGTPVHAGSAHLPGLSAYAGGRFPVSFAELRVSVSPVPYFAKAVLPMAKQTKHQKVRELRYTIQKRNKRELGWYRTRAACCREADKPVGHCCLIRQLSKHEEEKQSDHCMKLAGRGWRRAHATGNRTPLSWRMNEVNCWWRKYAGRISVSKTAIYVAGGCQTDCGQWVVRRGRLPAHGLDTELTFLTTIVSSDSHPQICSCSGEWKIR
jgi:hypothetical protein